MIRRFAPWFGTGLLVVTGGYLAAFGRDAVADPMTAVLLAGLVVAAVLSIVGGVREAVALGPVTLPWNVLVGTADVLAALVVAVSTVRSLWDGGATTAQFADAALLVGCSSIAWFGVQTARDSRHVDLEASPSRTRLVATAALAVASMVGGVLVVTVV
ncbi:hypothetical protein HTZ84_18740 [Haloterrigena sp. SYSU A558-1]|uniref:Uncharacterized protein n=1 Tax=Haloterrigena gelatinilytica TaxID=2741724 RepID=A0ABX2LMH0_9EURY|nr:hypothetical protein [Haloterrigena gelatinilytica]NUC74309.1 hypothetical protein [Haloterrigena gelatinilytica]